MWCHKIIFLVSHKWDPYSVPVPKIEKRVDNWVKSLGEMIRPGETKQKRKKE